MRDKKRHEKFGVDSASFANWRWQIKNQLRSYSDFLNAGLLDKEAAAAFANVNDLFQIGVTPYYASLIDPKRRNDPIRIQASPAAEELYDPLAHEDPLAEKLHSPVPELVHLYPDRVAFCVAMLCPVYCRYCYRKRRDNEEGLHYNRSIIARGLDYIASQPAIRDVLITGGDPFIASDSSIVGLVRRLRAIPHVEIIRFGTRTPVTLPFRVTAELCSQLAQFHPIWVNTHFNCVEELSSEACQALDNLLSAGIPVGNQSVLLRGVNDSTEALSSLCRRLVQARVRPYYLFHPHLVRGTSHLRVSVKKGLEITKALRGKLSGFAIPSYVVDTPSGKVPINPNHILGHDGDDLLLEDLNGEVWREVGAWT